MLATTRLLIEQCDSTCDSLISIPNVKSHALLPVGLSGKSQILFGVVFITRYLDLVTNFVSIYNTVMKVFFLSSSIATVYLIYTKFKATYDGNHDTLRMEFLLLPCAVLALVVNHEFTPMEV